MKYGFALRGLALTGPRLPAAEVARILLGLELKLLVHQLPGQQYCLKK